MSFWDGIARAVNAREDGFSPELERVGAMPSHFFPWSRK